MKKRSLIFLIIALLAALGFVIFGDNIDWADINSTEEDTETFNIEVREVNYFEDVNGYLAQPSSDESFPGVVMIHEWWGLNENIEDMASQLAEQGYMVLAVDLYNGEIAETSDRASELSSSLDEDKALENLRAATNYLRENGSDRIASLGWCFGGGQSMQLSLAEEDLDATVIYYGSLETNPDNLSSIDWPVLGIFGEDDQVVSVESVEQFQEGLNQNNIENQIHIYPGVGHAFANPSGDNYSPEETQDAWNKTLHFLQENLK